MTTQGEVEVVVAAESEEEAQKVAHDNWRDIESSILQNPLDWLATDNWWLPCDWEMDCFPYGEDGDKNIGQYAAEEKLRRGQ